ncbi:MAG: divalent-cation tolerance protein CutA [Gammaproteobacteria bacterium]|nr:divalent-cation tolerance protein CutA [Gammaproteobacteria bacterium]
MNEHYLVVCCTCPDQPIAERIAEALVGEKLAACVNILTGVVSIYRWQGHLQRDAEVLLVIKTRDDRYPTLEQRIQELHPYEVPEVIALPVVRGASSYLDWISGSLHP